MPLAPSGPLPLPGFVTRPLAWLYEGAVTRRRRRYEAGLGAVAVLARPVVSIGNVTVGGTGKTPMIMALARLLGESGLAVSVLSRGYGGRRPVDPMTVTVDDPMGWRLVGDEPFLMKCDLVAARVTVGRNRYEAGLLAERSGAVDVHLLDDGFQHLRLQRQLDVVMVAESSALAPARCLPAGPFREPLGALRRADVVVVKGPSGRVSDEVAGRLRPHLRRDVPLLGSRLALRSLVRVGGAERVEVGWLAGRRVAGVAAVGDPASFRGTIEESGAELVMFEAFPDHHAFRPGTVASLDRRARERGAEAIVTTRKDAVRLAGQVGAAAELPVWALTVDLEVERMAWLVDRIGELSATGVGDGG